MEKTIKTIKFNFSETPIAIRILYALIMGVSCASLCAICNSRGYLPKQVLIGLIASFMIGVFVSWVHADAGFVLENNTKHIGIIVTALYLLRWLVNYTNRQTIQYMCDSLHYHIGWAPTNAKMLGIICTLSIPFTILISQIVLSIICPILCNYYKSLDSVEKRFYIIAGGLGLVFTTVCFIITTAFWMPTMQDGTVVDWDVIYTTDTGNLLARDVYANIGHGQNDIRQPLFAVFAMPFALIAHFLSAFLPFVTINRAYGIVMTLLQIITVTTIGILIVRMIGVRISDKPYYFLVYALSFPNIIFAEVLEQYVIASFYVVLCLYYWMSDSKERYNVVTVAATGTLLTSGVLLFFCSRTKSLSTWLKNLGKVIAFGVAVTTVSGQLPMLIGFKEQVLSLVNSYGGMQRPIHERIFQYSNFVNNVFFAPLGIVSNEGHPAYLLPPYSAISFVGIIVLLMVIAGWLMNCKKLYANICFLWVLFSQVILIVVGWGSSENGMVLYSLYFSWAYISLAFYFVDRVLKHKRGLLCIFAAGILMWNIHELINILSFAHLYYPVW